MIEFLEIYRILKLDASADDDENSENDGQKLHELLPLDKYNDADDHGDKSAEEIVVVKVILNVPGHVNDDENKSAYYRRNAEGIGDDVEHPLGIDQIDDADDHTDQSVKCGGGLQLFAFALFTFVYRCLIRLLFLHIMPFRSTSYTSCRFRKGRDRWDKPSCLRALRFRQPSARDKAPCAYPRRR